MATTDPRDPEIRSRTRLYDRLRDETDLTANPQAKARKAS